MPDRRCADVIFILRTGAQWAALTYTKLCPTSTAHVRFQEWVQAGVSLKPWQAGGERFDELRSLDREWLSMGGATTKGPPGGEKIGPDLTDRGKTGDKRSVLTKGLGVPKGVAVDGAKRHDMKMLSPTIASIVVGRPHASTEQLQGMCLDAGYSVDEVRATLAEFGAMVPIRGRSQEAKAPRPAACG